MCPCPSGTRRTHAQPRTHTHAHTHMHTHTHMLMHAHTHISVVILPWCNHKLTHACIHTHAHACTQKGMRGDDADAVNIRLATVVLLQAACRRGGDDAARCWRGHCVCMHHVLLVPAVCITHTHTRTTHAGIHTPAQMLMVALCTHMVHMCTQPAQMCTLTHTCR